MNSELIYIYKKKEILQKILDLLLFTFEDHSFNPFAARDSRVRRYILAACDYTFGAGWSIVVLVSYAYIVYYSTENRKEKFLLSILY